MLNNKKFSNKRDIVLPPLSDRQRILEQYYKNLEIMDRIDAYISYDTSMHLLYCKYNPYLKFQGFDKNGKPKPRKLLKREDFVRAHDQFGFPLWVNDLSPELFERWAAGEDIPRPKKTYN